MGLYDFVTDEAAELNPLTASVAVTITPMIILFTLVRQYLTEVLTGANIG